MSFDSEKELQRRIMDALKNQSILDAITGVEELENSLNRDVNAGFIPGFQIDFQLRALYCEKAKEVLDSLGLYNIISGEEIKNISIQKDTGKHKERLYPDVLITNPERNNFSIIELKKSRQTEREAITELFAYAIEVKNHLPNIADSDIHLVIISTEFNTLLDHSISSIVLGTKFNILALKAELQQDNLVLNLHIPDSWTDIWQNNLPEHAFSSVSLIPYLYSEDKKIPDEGSLFDIIGDLITFYGAKNNSHGFFLIWENITSFEGAASFGVSMYQMNPFVFLQASLENHFPLNTNEPLSRYILENSQEFEYCYSQSLMNIAGKVKEFLDQYYHTCYEDLSSWTDHACQGSAFRSQALPLVFNSWGNIGDYVRYYFFHPSLRNGFYSEKQLNSSLFYKNPLFGLELMNRISGYTLFQNGVYNFTSLFAYAKQLRELLDISEWYVKAKEQNKSFELLQPRLFFATLDVLASAREIQYRVNYIRVKMAIPAPLKINPFEVYEDSTQNIIDNLNWFAREFLKDNPLHQDFFANAVNWCVYYMQEEGEMDPSFEKDIQQGIIEYTKTHIFSILEGELISGSSFFGDRVFDILSVYFDSIEQVKQTRSDQDLLKLVGAIDHHRILTHFKDAFLELLDTVYLEVFHPISDFSDISFVTKDWKKLQLQLIKRFNEGHRYGAIFLDTNGNLSVGVLPTEYQCTKPINDPEKEVYVLLNFSGMGFCRLVTWEEVKDGSAFVSEKN